MVGTVSSSNQNQAINALVFLPKQVLTMPLEQAINAVQARRKEHVPVVLQREEVDSRHLSSGVFAGSMMS